MLDVYLLNFFAMNSKLFKRNLRTINARTRICIFKLLGGKKLNLNFRFVYIFTFPAEPMCRVTNFSSQQELSVFFTPTGNCSGGQNSGNTPSAPKLLWDFLRVKRRSDAKKHQQNRFHGNIPLAAQRLLQLVYRAVQVFVGAAQFVNFCDGVHHGGVVLTSELASDFGQ